MVEIGMNVAKLQTDVGKVQNEFGKLTRQMEGLTRASERAATAQEKTSSSIAGLSRSILRLYAEYYVLSAAIGGVGRALLYGVEAIDKYNLAAVQTAAIMTGMMKADNRSLSERYQQAYAYAQQLNVTLEEVDKNTMLNFTQLQDITKEMMKQGVVMDTNSKEEIAAFTQISNALATISQGAPNKEIQLRQEIRALLQGQARDTDQLSQMLDAQLNGKLKEEIALHKKNGDLITWLGSQLKGFAAAQAQIDASWETTKSSLQTIAQRILREGFSTAYREIIGYTQQLSEWAIQHKEEIAGAVGGGWQILKTTIEAIIWPFQTLIELTSKFKMEVISVGTAIIAMNLASMISNITTLTTATKGLIVVMEILGYRALTLVASKFGAIGIAIGGVIYMYERMSRMENIDPQIARLEQLKVQAQRTGVGLADINFQIERLKKLKSEKSGVSGDLEAYVPPPVANTKPTLNSFTGDLANKKTTASQYASALRSITDETTAWTNKIAEMNPGLEKQDSEILKLTNDANELIKRIQDQGAKGKVDVSSFISTIKESLGVGQEYVAEKERLKYHEEYIKMVSDEADFASTENERAINKIISQEQEKIEKLMDIWASGAISDQEFTTTETQIRDNAAQARIEIETETAKKIADINYNLISDISGMQDWAYKLRLEQIDAEAEKYRKDGAAVQAIEAWKGYQRQLAVIQKTIAGYDMFAGFKAQADQYALDMKTAGQQGSDLFTQSHAVIKDSFSTLFSDLRTGELKSFSDYMSSFANKIASVWENMLAEMLANWIMTGNALRGSQSMDGSGGISGFLSKLLGAGSSLGGTASTPSDTAAGGESFVDYAEYAGTSWEGLVSESGISFVNDIDEATSNFSTSMTGLFNGVTGSFANMFGQIFSALGIGAGLGAVGGNSLGGTIGAVGGMILGSLIPIPGISQVIGGLIGSAIGGLIGGFFHDGGIVGQSHVPTRVFSPSVFATAPQLHSGLRADEFPAILQKGEEVIPKGKTRGTTVVHNHYYQIKGSVVTTKSLARDLVPIMKQAVAGGAH